MSHIETANTKLSLPVFVAIAEVLDVRADDLLYDDAPADSGTVRSSLQKILDQLHGLEETVRKAMSEIDTGI
ncbi:MAG: hypothetical protein IKM54_05965 [Butyricicoccus sp.]|nr:hypothetical protein [Butyricicoccus sp.]